MAHELKVPSVGESITEVYIGRWHKAVGDAVQEGDVLVELESDKAMVELPAPSSGTLKQILKQEGNEAQVGEVIGLLEAGAGAPEGQPAPEATAQAAAEAALGSGGAPATATMPEAPADTDGRDADPAPAAQAAPTADPAPAAQAAPAADGATGAAAAIVMPAAQK